VKDDSRPKNLAASLRARLLTRAKERGAELQLVLSEFAIERLLHRLGVSTQRDAFVLKGATLLRMWSRDLGRATWDLDLLGRGLSGVTEAVEAIRSITAIRVDDGIEFDVGSIEGEEIKVADEYPGVRVRLVAKLAGARIPIQIDLGYGDAVVPPPTLEVLPTLLDLPAPRVLVYPRETVVAEKLDAMVTLGLVNSRMKDFYDVDWLAASYSFDGELLQSAVRASFASRSTKIVDTTPLILVPGVLAAPERATQWRSFIKRTGVVATVDPESLAQRLRLFVVPLFEALHDERVFEATWLPTGPWRVR